MLSSPARLRLQGPGKRWEHYELTKNFKPVRIPIHVKSGDTIKVCGAPGRPAACPCLFQNSSPVVVATAVAAAVAAAVVSARA
jgi:hypothetical protein